MNNPMKWDCKVHGCFNEKRRLKFSRLTEKLPERVGMSDIDGIIEKNGHFLLVEWKNHIGQLSDGQRILFEKLTIHSRFTVLIVVGDAETMTVQSLAIAQHGIIGRPRIATISDVADYISHWYKRAAGRGRRLPVPIERGMSA